jgi:hypothetical protein
MNKLICVKLIDGSMIVCEEKINDCMYLLTMIEKSLLVDKRIELKDIGGCKHYLKPALIADIFEAPRGILEENQEENEGEIDLSTDQD